MDKSPVVFFDAECLVCNRFGRLLLRSTDDILLAPIGGSTYTALKLPAEMRGVDSIVYWNGEKAFIRVEAIRQIAAHRGGSWKFLAILSRIVPTAVLDFFYDRFASWRYRLFGRVESCALIPKEYRSRLKS